LMPYPTQDYVLGYRSAAFQAWGRDRPEGARYESQGRSPGNVSLRLC
jgi:hypothetical protein